MLLQIWENVHIVHKRIFSFKDSDHGIVAIYTDLKFAGMIIGMVAL